jgi:hypothetical protein
MQLVVPIHHITTFDFHPSNLKRNNYSHEIALHLKHLLMSLLQKEIRLRITLEGLKGHLLEKSNSDFQGLFAAVDVYCQNVIDPDK